jgi:thymidine kinase
MSLKKSERVERDSTLIDPSGRLSTGRLGSQVDPHSLVNHQVGWIEVVCGPMFSGKTEELIRRLRRAQIAKQRVEIFKPSIDVRYAQDAVVSHDETTLKSVPVDTAEQILLLAGSARVVGIDEAQFFGLELVPVVQMLAEQGRRVVIAGLDLDYRGEPFEPVPQLMAVAEYVTKLHAVCMVCGGPAIHSQRIVKEGKRVLVGSKAAYEPRCRSCFVRPSEPKSKAKQAAKKRRRSRQGSSDTAKAAAKNKS